MVASRAGMKASRMKYQGTRARGLTTQPRPSLVVLNSVGTKSLGVVIAMAASIPVHTNTDVKTAKSAMLFRTWDSITGEDRDIICNSYSRLTGSGTYASFHGLWHMYAISKHSGTQTYYNQCSIPVALMLRWF